jgi:hypothetical protein
MTDNDFQGRLLPGERIQWTGAPPGGILFMPGDAMRVPFSLMWGGFAVFWEWSVLHIGNAPDFFVLWGIPFVLVGLYLIVGRFFVDAWVRTNTAYAVTTQRVLILRTAPTFRFTAYSIDRLPELSLEERADGRGTIRFLPQVPMWSNRGWSSWTPSTDPTQFLLISDARSVFDRIQKSTARSGT